MKNSKDSDEKEEKKEYEFSMMSQSMQSIVFFVGSLYSQTVSERKKSKSTIQSWQRRLGG